MWEFVHLVGKLYLLYATDVIDWLKSYINDIKHITDTEHKFTQ